MLARSPDAPGPMTQHRPRARVPRYLLAGDPTACGRRGVAIIERAERAEVGWTAWLIPLAARHRWDTRGDHCKSEARAFRHRRNHQRSTKQDSGATHQPWQACKKDLTAAEYSLSG